MNEQEQSVSLPLTEYVSLKMNSERDSRHVEEINELTKRLDSMIQEKQELEEKLRELRQMYDDLHLEIEKKNVEIEKRKGDILKAEGENKKLEFQLSILSNKSIDVSSWQSTMTTIKTEVKTELKPTEANISDPVPSVLIIKPTIPPAIFKRNSTGSIEQNKTEPIPVTNSTMNITNINDEFMNSLNNVVNNNPPKSEQMVEDSADNPDEVNTAALFKKPQTSNFNVRYDWVVNIVKNMIKRNAAVPRIKGFPSVLAADVFKEYISSYTPEQINLTTDDASFLKLGSDDSSKNHMRCSVGSFNRCIKKLSEVRNRRGMPCSLNVVTSCYVYIQYLDTFPFDE